MRDKSQESRVESQTGSLALRSHSGSRLSTLDSRLTRRGVTLIELLITIMIISILAAALLGVAAVAGETAREASTRNMVSRIHTLLFEHLDTYRSRRIRLRKTVDPLTNHDGIKQLIDTNISSGAGYLRRRGEALQEARVYALREMMLMEIPDRWSDVYLNDLSESVPGVPYFLESRTDVSSLYLRRYGQLLSRVNSITGMTNTRNEIVANQGAECLYLVIMTATADGEARSLFNESSIGDTDGDGAPEFLDGWGNPITFLRWAPGFESDIQVNAIQFGMPMDPDDDDDWVKAANADHDPFDLFRVEAAAYRLVPLIYSTGQDEEAGIVDEPNYVAWRKSNPVSVSASSPYFRVGSKRAFSPYLFGSPDYPQTYLGTRIDETATDNIHNHLLGQRL